MNAEELLKKYGAGTREFIAADLREANLSGVNLSQANLSQANLSVSNLSGANLSEADLSRAKLNVARLSGANLSKANLSGANLNVANLIRADLSGANLTQAALVRAELVLADLSGVNFSRANLSEANLREAKLRQANLMRANLSAADLRGASLTGATLEQANLQGADLSKADLSGANLSGAELRQANLNQANLSGADLSGANLRWADLSGAKLHGADLSGAKLSGADLSRADLSNTNLMNTSLVYADLSQVNLIRADWVGADLTGATLTGAKVHAVSRFGIKTEGITCDWIDLSPTGDQSQIHRFAAEEHKKFFKSTPPTVQIIIDAPLEPASHLAIAAAYYQMAQQCPTLSYPPSIEVGRRRTTLTFGLNGDEQLFAIAYVAILPFQDAKTVQQQIMGLLHMVRSQGTQELSVKELERLEQLSTALAQISQQVAKIRLSPPPIQARPANSEKSTPQKSVQVKETSFFAAPTQTILTNSSDRTLTVYYHSMFGKRFMSPSSFAKAGLDSAAPAKPMLLPVSLVIDFVRGFYYLDL